MPTSKLQNSRSAADTQCRLGVPSGSRSRDSSPDLGHARRSSQLAAEYEAAETRESRLAHDADKIETLLQAIEHEAQGHDAAAWRETSLAALRTDSGRQLAQAIGSADPHGWWSAFAASYGELRASSRGRGRRQPGRATE